MKRFLLIVSLAVAIVTAPAAITPDLAAQTNAAWYYTTTDGVYLVTKVWNPLTRGGGYWSIYSVDVYMGDPTLLNHVRWGW